MPGISFETRLSVAEILKFYRDAYKKLGLAEDTLLTQIDQKSASMVMTDPGPLKLVVQVSTFDELSQIQSAYTHRQREV